MANLKSITELPMAESAEGLNLIVNDNGAAKQIAASAVGAQADWAEMDENSPAFVKNKPFYDTREFATVTVTFDGDLTGKEFIQEGGSEAGIKISDYIFLKEELVGVILKIVTPEGNQTLEITEEMIHDMGGMTVVAFGEGGMPLVVIIPQEVIEAGAPFTSAGTWINVGLQDNIPVFYVSELSWTSVVNGELKMIDEKYVPRLPEKWDLDIDVDVLFKTDGEPEYSPRLKYGTFDAVKNKILNNEEVKFKTRFIFTTPEDKVAYENNVIFTALYTPQDFYDVNSNPEMITMLTHSYVTDAMMEIDLYSDNMVEAFMY